MECPVPPINIPRDRRAKKTPNPYRPNEMHVPETPAVMTPPRKAFSDMVVLLAT